MEIKHFNILKEDYRNQSSNRKWEIEPFSYRVGNIIDKLLVHKLCTLKGGNNIHSTGIQKLILNPFKRVLSNFYKSRELLIILPDL